jgi:nitroreductase
MTGGLIMNVYDAIRLRKSVRSFQKKEVPDEVLNKILNAARLAPSARNRQEWRFIIVRNPDTRRKLAEAAKKQMFIAEAPVVIVCCAEAEDLNYVMTCGQLAYPIDLAIAIDHITLAAVAEGLGTCWIGAFYENEVKKILNIPENIRVVELLPLGYPADPSAVEKNRLPLEKIVKYEKWSP